MPETVAHYSFLPWLRQGLNAQIVEQDTLGAAPGVALERAQLSVSVMLRAQPVDGAASNDHTISKKINVVGPGDVQNVSERVIVRVNPPRNISNFEANNLAYIEFYEEDFLWRYTPASANLANAATAKRLRPWLALIVLKDDEYKQQNVQDALSFVQVKSEKFADVFHDPTQTWAFGHVHFNQVLESTDIEALKGEVNAELKSDPDTAVSRLLCPRKLTPGTAYTAVLIPAFETGRRTGLGLEPTGVPAQESSWVKGGGQASKPRPFDFPVYFQWRFRTGNDGDFESLVTKLKPIVMKPESGSMPMDVQEVGYGMDGRMERTIMGMEAALRPPSFDQHARENFPVTPDEQEVSNQLRTFLNLSPSINRPDQIRNIVDTDDKAFNPFYEGSLTDDPMIVPPLYGAWHSMAQDLNTGQNYPWFLELNLDFRNRAAAGLGTKVVQNNQEELMHRAWQQVEKINEANQKIIEAELSKLVNNAIYKKHLSSAREDKFLMVTKAVQQLALTDGAVPVHQIIEESRIPVAAQSAGFLKMTRPVKKLQKLELQKSVISNFNKEGEGLRLTAAKLKTAPAAAIPMEEASKMVSEAIDFYKAETTHSVKDVLLNLLNENITAANTPALKAALQTSVNNKPDLPATLKAEVNGVINNIQDFKNGDVLEVTLAAASYEQTFDNFSAAKTYDRAKVINAGLIADVDAKTMAATTIADIQNFEKRLGGLAKRIDAIPVVASKSRIADLKAVRNDVAAQIKPDFALSRRIKLNIKIWDGTGYKPVKELKPVMSYPEFHEPVYEYLEKISQNFILPNVEKLPANSITLLETNQRFIESYMAGLNHEMARELLWREYPTDQRGSYFRQFWNIADNLEEDNAADPDDKKDIKVMDLWQSNLGKHRPGFNGDILVLVVRGELLHKYPNTMVYAQKAVYNGTDASKARELSNPAVIKFPLFSADLKPDITLFGFALTAEEANGHRIENSSESTVGKNPGWFFVFKERPGQLQFGLDDFTTPTGDTTQMPSGAPKTWNDFTWEHMVATKAALNNYQLDATKAIAISDPNSVKDRYSQLVPFWNSNAAEIASILYQDPVLFARHAGEMLNEDLLDNA